MTDSPRHSEETPGHVEPPAIHRHENDGENPLGPEDTDAGPDGKFPDPDDYAGADDHELAPAARQEGASKDATADIVERQERGNRPDPNGRPPADAPSA